MNKTTVEKLIEKMENNNILMNNAMTFSDYTDELIKFQELVTKLILGNEYYEGMRIDSAIFKLEEKARRLDLFGDIRIRKGIAALKTVQKEIAICMSGKKGEDLVSKTLEYVDRPEMKIYRNVYMSSGNDETELDSILVTDSGIIIIEIKSSPDNLVITEDGRLVHQDNQCHGKKKIVEKMLNKRKILTDNLLKKISDLGLNIPVMVDSYIVFSSSKGKNIQVDDRYHLEKWCIRTQLTRIINEYSGEGKYSDDQLAILNDIMEHFEIQKKCFTPSIDFNHIRSNIAEALITIGYDSINCNLNSNLKEVTIKDNLSYWLDNKLITKLVMTTLSVAIGIFSFTKK